MYTTVTPVTNEMGMMQIGDPFARLEGQPVSDGLKHHVLECPSSCVRNNIQMRRLQL
jgi:hypothetical protein